MLKTFITAILALGLMSPLCLCGDAVTESHSAVTKAAWDCSVDHHHEHHDGEEESEHEGPVHSHSHSEARLAVSGTVMLPPVVTFDLADWAIVIPQPDSEPMISAVARLAIHEVASSRRCDALVTGVFLL